MRIRARRCGSGVWGSKIWGLGFVGLAFRLRVPRPGVQGSQDLWFMDIGSRWSSFAHTHTLTSVDRMPKAPKRDHNRNVLNIFGNAAEMGPCKRTTSQAQAGRTCFQ